MHYVAAVLNAFEAISNNSLASVPICNYDELIVGETVTSWANRFK